MAFQSDAGSSHFIDMFAEKFSSLAVKEYQLKDDPTIRNQLWVVFNAIFPENTCCAFEEYALAKFMSHMQSQASGRFGTIVANLVCKAINEQVIKSIVSKVVDQANSIIQRARTDRRVLAETIDEFNFDYDLTHFKYQLPESEFKNIMADMFMLDVGNPTALRDAYLSFMTIHGKDIETEFETAFPNIDPYKIALKVRGVFPTRQLAEKRVEECNRFDNVQEGELFHNNIANVGKYVMIDRRTGVADYDKFIETVDPSIRALFERQAANVNQERQLTEDRFQQCRQAQQENTKLARAQEEERIKAYQEKMRLIAELERQDKQLLELQKEDGAKDEAKGGDENDGTNEQQTDS